jgi:hypothetical protein
VFPAVRIADWEGVNPQVRGRLLVTAIRAGRFQQLATWTFGASEADFRILRECGFVPERLPAGVSGQGINVFVKALVEGDDRLGGVPIFAPGNWEYRMIYSVFA